LAGVKFGFTLLWAMVLSIIATIVLQEMAARLGLVTQKDLAAVVKQEIRQPLARWIALGLMVSAILVGNAAYEAGNLSGAVLGLEALIPQRTMETFPFAKLGSFVVGGISFLLLYIGNYKILERVLVALVLLMSMAFLVTAFLTNPNWGAVLQSVVVPTVPENGWISIIALVGTTVVPYNLFLHASLVMEKWNGKAYLGAARTDLYISVILGGLVSMAIIVCGAAIQASEVSTAADMAQGLAPLFGNLAAYFLGIGLFAAGITSAITAPLAAAYVARGCFGWSDTLRDTKFRAVWMAILALGVLFASLGFKPIDIIQFAQVANGLLLPIIAVFLLWSVNRTHLLGKYKNNWLQNVLGILITALAFLLGMRSLWNVFS
jgi:NRAMP (natural resistance-associated macrophage protein)-like metal ion transporter